MQLYHEAFWGNLPAVSDAIARGGEEGAKTALQAAWPPNFEFFVLAAVGVVILSLLIGQYVFRRCERTFAQDL